MAFSNIFKAKKHSLKVKSYTINQAEVLGQGAFGVVFRGTDAKKNPIAAKRIDGNVHPRILTQDLDRLMKLDHQNVMKILDVERNDNIVWMMMPFCELGDLNNFYKTRDICPDTNSEVMKQIIIGIEYLHRQDIVHRDIKPGNILVASENPLIIQLTDFDACKCLDPEVETSLMTSNVGTLAFKAPEFFQRSSPGKIEYHRNVDIYAAGLTFLAILQAEKGKKMLIPQIETPMDDSEYHAPSIGQLISERIKYKVPELNIVRIEGLQRNLKRLISQMTWVNPEKRLSAERVLDFLKNAEIKKIKLIREKTFPVFGPMDVTDKDLLLIRELEESKYWIQVMHRLTGDLINEIPSMCDHKEVLVKKCPQYNYAFESCQRCGEIYAHNINTGESFCFHKGPKIVEMCDGPAGSLLVVDTLDTLDRLWKVTFEQHKSPSVFVQHFRPMLIKVCYVEHHDIIMFTAKDMKDNQHHELIAKKLGNETIVWRLSGPVDGQIIKPQSITCDADGNAYFNDGGNNRILKIDSLTGEVLSILLFEEKEITIHSMRWSDTEPNLTIRRANDISTYFVPK